MAPTFSDPLFTIKELCEHLHLERHTCARLFREEKGVIVLASHPKRRTRTGVRRSYKLVRVPLSVVNRVLARLGAGVKKRLLTPAEKVARRESAPSRALR
jgi:hypothetical protein